jgi:very-short-patch-repair endonuclease
MMLRRTRIARRLQADATRFEDLLWEQLRNRRLDGWKFRRQFPVGDRFVDFCCLDAKLTIELDGVHHAAQPLADGERRRIIEANGFLEARFSNQEVEERMDWVLTEIRRALDTARAQTPRPPFARMDDSQ